MRRTVPEQESCCLQLTVPVPGKKQTGMTESEQLESVYGLNWAWY